MIGMTRMKDIDGAREVEWEATATSVFVWGKNFSYEFDRAIFGHQISRLLNTEPERASQ